MDGVIVQSTRWCNMVAYDEIVPFETAQMDDSVIVPFEMAQIPNVLFCTGWTNHQIVLNRCKTDAERLFYILYAGRERLENKELMRAIKTDTMSSLLGGKNVQSNKMAKAYPNSPVLFKEKVYLDMLGLPLRYKESKLRKEIIAHMKDFILEMGKDFLFVFAQNLGRLVSYVHGGFPEGFFSSVYLGC